MNKSGEKNLSLVKKAILEPSYINRDKVEDSFQNHFYKVAKIKYISTLIHFFSKDFHRRVRKQHDRSLLILDKETSSDSSTTQKELIEDKNQDMNKFTANSLSEIVEDETLTKAIKLLSEKQILILGMIYLKELTQKEISVILQTTPQNISNHHRKSLKKLKETLNKE